MKNILLTLMIFLPCATMLKAQHDDLWIKLKEKFPDEPAVFVERNESLNIILKDDSLHIFSDEFEDILYLKEQAEAFSGKRVYGSHFNQVENIKAKTLVWEKNKYKEMNVSDFKKNNDRSGSIFYDDSYYYSFNFPSIAPRNRTQLRYHNNIKDAHFLSGFMFSTYMPAGKAVFNLKTSKEINIVYKVVNDPEGKVRFRKTEKGNFITYEWVAESVPAVKVEDASPSIRYFAPHVLCYVKSYQTKKGIVNMANDASDLYGWYNTFVKGLNKEPAAELVAIVEDLKAKSKTEEDLVKNVFYWVQENIQYIAFEDGMRGLIPHDGSYVCSKRYGDCKDMANLIVNMLHIAGVRAYHTWIGTRDLPYKYSELPTAMVDNHMIATYITKDKQYYFLDGTSDHTPFGFPSSMIQGKEALIGIDDKTFEIKEVPVINKEKNIMVDSISFQLQNNEITGKGYTTLSGYAKVFGGYELDRAAENDVKKYVTKLIGKGSNKFYLDEYSIANLDNREKATAISYNFRIGDYFQKIGDEIYINMNLNKDFYNDFINLSLRKTPKEFDYKYVKQDFYEMEIPAGYSVEYLPASAEDEGSLMGYDIAYKIKENKILFTKTFYVDCLLLQPENFGKWNDAVKKISEEYKESIILKKK